MNQQDPDFNDEKLPPDYLDADQANQEFWEHDLHLPDFWRPFDGNLVDHSPSNDCNELALMALLALSCFTFGWFLSAIIFS